MTWTYEQITGRLFHNNELVGTGYSGHDPHKNDPDAQYVKGIGPIPVGKYFIGPMHDSPNVGPDMMSLDAMAGTDTHGRGDFKMHGDSIKTPGTASHGCIIMAHPIRLQVAKSGDTSLEVVRGSL